MSAPFPVEAVELLESLGVRAGRLRLVRPAMDVLIDRLMASETTDPAFDG